MLTHLTPSLPLFVAGMIATLTLTSCAAGLDGEYACGAVGGISGCTDMMAMRTLTDADLYPPTLPTSSTALAFDVPRHASDITRDAIGFIPQAHRDRHGFPIRTSESVQKITIFPFINNNGDLVDITHVYIVLNKSHWMGRPADNIKQDEQGLPK